MTLTIRATLVATLAPCACARGSATGAAAAPSIDRRQVVDAATKARIDSTLRHCVESGAIAGASALVYEKGAEVYFRAFGMADREAARPMGRDDHSRPHAPHRRIRHQPDDPGVGPPLRVADPLNRSNTLTQMAERLGTVPLWFHPGEKWAYGPSVDVQAFLVERISGQSFDRYVQERVFAPLGMRETGTGGIRHRLRRARAPARLAGRERWSDERSAATRWSLLAESRSDGSATWIRSRSFNSTNEDAPCRFDPPALRDSLLDVYKIPATGGEEIRLTSAPGVDDGPEYTPDGAFIYFNSSRSGRMQIWRMRPDGTAQERVTTDEFNNWFPHISPDGRWIAYIAFPPQVAPDDHPFYKHVLLRLMPIEGGRARVIAYLYGGQGTINVPSWSPDGKRLAFVSNSGVQVR